MTEASSTDLLHRSTETFSDNANCVHSVCMFSHIQALRRVVQAFERRNRSFEGLRQTKKKGAKGTRLSIKELIRGSHLFALLSLLLLLLLKTEVAGAGLCMRATLAALATSGEPGASEASGASKAARGRQATTQVLAVVVLAVVTHSSFHPTLSSSLPFTGMITITRAACFSPSITSSVPYLLTSLHVTISTAIRAVDDNQTCD